MWKQKRTGQTADSSDPGWASKREHLNGKLQEVQLARLGRLLKDSKNERRLRIPEKQYAALQAEQRKAPKPEAAILPAHVLSALDKLGDLFGWWERVLMPNFTPRLVQDPPPSLGEGGIGADVFKGSLSLNGHTFSHGTHEQWWVRTWQSTVPNRPETRLTEVLEGYAV